MPCYWIGSVFRGAHQRSIFLRAADEETPRSRGEAPTTTHSLLSKASGVEKRDFDEATAFYSSVVWGQFWGIICVKYHLCAFQIFLSALDVFAWNEAQTQRHSFRFLALNTMTGKRKQKKTEQKNDTLPMFLNECRLQMETLLIWCDDMNWHCYLKLWVSVNSHCYLDLWIYFMSAGTVI